MFDAEFELEMLRANTEVIRQRRYRKSRLDKYSSELIRLRLAGATIAELQRWLRPKRIRVHHTTIARWLMNNGAL
jgi:hypothetical protein